MRVQAKRVVNPSPEKARAAGRFLMAAATSYYPPLGFLQEAVQVAPVGKRGLVALALVVGWLLYRRKR
jgi:hypothetical protein